MKLKLVLMICILSRTASQCDVDFSRVTFIVMSQRSKRHEAIANLTIKNVEKKLMDCGIDRPKVFDVQKDFSKKGSWTIFPIATKLIEKSPDSDWFVFLHETSEVNLKNLSKVLLKYNGSGEPQDHFIGSELVDRFGSFIHFRARRGSRFHDEAAGFILSRSLLVRLSDEVERNRGLLVEVTVDSAFELAQILSFISTASLVHEPTLCAKFQPECSIYPRPHDCKVASKRLLTETLFVVKTMRWNHASRLSVVQKTWANVVKTALKYVRDREENEINKNGGRDICNDVENVSKPDVQDSQCDVTLNVIDGRPCDALKNVENYVNVKGENVIFASDIVEPEFSTTVLDGAEENTTKGHCRKTQAILRYFRQHYNSRRWKWLIITDDDTMLSPAKLLHFLSCYDPQEKVAIGERYGHHVAGVRGRLGFDYPAGGAGMIFSHAAVEEMMSQSHVHCKCPSATFPDDLHIGQCLLNLDIPFVNSNRFHQARPMDYNETLLARQDPISFHKFEEENPFQVYSKWFKDADELLLKRFRPNKCNNT